MNNIGSADLKLLKDIYKDNLDYALNKLKENYPIQYLIGYVDFYNLKIKVNENVLIPRFETEYLIDESLKLLKNKKTKNILDIGTGSGAIAIALQKNLNINVDACDISAKALELAIKNAKDNNVNINFFKLDILNEIPINKYDCIISNPPYVKIDEYTSPETKYEPNIALYANNNGLEFYEKILSISRNILNENGIIIFEIGATLTNDIKKLTLNYLKNPKITIKKDFNNFDRIMFIET